MSEDHDWFVLSRRQFMQATAATMAASQTTLAKAPKKGRMTAARYICRRLSEHGAEVLFGVPGATCDPLFAAAFESDSGMKVAITSSDLEAGYAADGYARMKGLSALSVTYGVGTMSMIGVVAGAYAERSPIVVLNGGPHGTDLRYQRDYDTYFSHSMGKERTDFNMFKEVTARSERADKAKDVPGVVDRAIETALIERRPVYVEIPKNVWEAGVGEPRRRLTREPPASGQESTLADDILSRLGKAKKPALLLGVELQRYGLAEQASALVKKLGIPYSTTMLGKSVIKESTPHFAGVYAGGRSVPAIRTLVEQADAVLALGCVFGRQYRRLVTQGPKKMLIASGGTVRLAGQKGRAAALPTLMKALTKARYAQKPVHQTRNPLRGLSFEQRRASLGKVPPPPREPGLSYDEVMSAVSKTVSDHHVVITDTSLSMYPAADLNIAGQSAFVCNGVWQSIGFSAGAASGVALGSGKRALVVCGDGGFQMTAQSLSTLAKNNLAATVLVLDNGHYAIEQFLLDRSYFAARPGPAIPYLELNRWDYPAFARALGFKHAQTVGDQAALSRALAAADGNKGPSFIAARVKPHDMPGQLRV